jgi:arginase
MTASPLELVDARPRRRPLVIGAPLDGSGSGRGELRAPAALRAAALVDRLAAGDFGDLDVAIEDPARDAETGIIGFAELVAASQVIRDAVGSALAAAWLPVVLGGCCSVVPGAVAGARRRLGPAGLAFVDGHLDLFDGRTSRTGEAAGMDLAILLGRGPAGLIDLAGKPPLLDATDAIAVGDGDHPRRVAYRAPGPAEIAPELRVIDCAAVRDRGAAEVGAAVARDVGAGSAPFWLHFDLDVVDGGTMPAVSFPVATGLGWDDVTALLAPLVASPRLIGVTVTDFNADNDGDGLLARRIVDVLGSAFDARAAA